MSWERELRVLNEAIRRLNAEYDAFLYGGATRPPVDSRKHVEEMFRRLSASPPDAASERYLFSALQNRYYTLCERWERLQAEKESGRRPGVHGGFAAPVQSDGAPARPAPPNAPTAGSVREERRTGGRPTASCSTGTSRPAAVGGTTSAASGSTRFGPVSGRKRRS